MIKNQLRVQNEAYTCIVVNPDTIKEMKKIKKVTGQLRTRFGPIVRRLAHSSLPEILFVSTFILQRWRENSDISYPSEVVIPIFLFACAVTVAFYIYRLILKQAFAAHVASLLLAYFGLYRYSFSSDNRFGQFVIKLIPRNLATPFTKSVVLVLFLATLSGLAGYGLVKLINGVEILQKLQLQRVLLFAVIFVFAFEFIRAGGRLWQIRHELSYKYPAPSAQKVPNRPVANKPNIYFLMYEDYANEETLNSVNNFDNSPLLNYLSGQGFVNRHPAAYSNYPFTVSSLASVLAMNYFPDLQQNFGKDDNWQTTFPYRSIINNPPIAQLLKKNGYTYNQLGSWWEDTRVNIRADNQPTKGYRLNIFKWHFFLSDLARDIVNTSVFSPWLKKGVNVGHTPLILYDKDYTPPENLKLQTDALKDIASHSSNGLPQFTFGHFMIPHTPYIFKPDGKLANYDSEHNDNGAPENQKYSNQVAYINSQIEDMVGYIRSHDNQAVILIQSDEGSYPPQFRYEQTPTHYYDPINLPVPEMRQKFGILASYYLPGTDSENKGQKITSAVNAFPFVLNNYLGYDLPLLPDCHFATGNKYVLYNYKLVTDKLTGEPAPAECLKYQ